MVTDGMGCGDGKGVVTEAMIVRVSLFPQIQVA